MISRRISLHPNESVAFLWRVERANTVAVLGFYVLSLLLKFNLFQVWLCFFSMTFQCAAHEMTAVCNVT